MVATRHGVLIAGLACLLPGCSWPEYAFPKPQRGCSDDMRTCLRMDESPAVEGWTLTLSGSATAETIAGFDGNQVMRFTTAGSEGAPGPLAAFSWTVGEPIARARLLFDFRVAMIGPYTRVVVAKVTLGARAVQFELQSMPREQVVLRLVDADAQVVEERVVPEASFFEQTRLIELAYDLNPPGRTASVAVEGVAALELPLGDDWRSAPPTLQFGAIDYEFPTSEAAFEIDNLGFDDSH